MLLSFHLVCLRRLKWAEISAFHAARLFGQRRGRHCAEGCQVMIEVAQQALNRHTIIQVGDVGGEILGFRDAINSEG
jgi:hypothetical protein